MLLCLQCPQNPCQFFNGSGLCFTQCATCGILCESFPISDLPSLELYSSRGCTEIAGDLYIQNIPPGLRKSVLFENLATVKVIRGSLYMLDNMYNTAMTFFKNVEEIEGSIHYSNNPWQMDAELASLVRLGGNVTVEGCDRLCPARYSSIQRAQHDDDSTAREQDCANPFVQYYLVVVGNATLDDLGIIGSTIGRSTVCDLYAYFLPIHRDVGDCRVWATCLFL